MAGPFRRRKPVVRRRLPSAFVDRALKLAGAQRKVGPFEPILLCSVRFMDSAVRTSFAKGVVSAFPEEQTRE